MTKDIRKIIIQTIADNFLLPVYGQQVPQGAEKPCFTVELKEMQQKRLLGRRAVRTAVFRIGYFCAEAATAAAESFQVAEELYEILLIIGDEEKFAASGMQHEWTGDGLQFMVKYEYHILFDEEEEGLMERLEYNGKEAVGYEEENNVQQGTAE